MRQVSGYNSTSDQPDACTQASFKAFVTNTKPEISSQTKLLTGLQPVKFETDKHDYEAEIYLVAGWGEGLYTSTPKYPLRRKITLSSV